VKSQSGLAGSGRVRRRSRHRARSAPQCGVSHSPRASWVRVRGEYSIAELCRREGIAESLYYSWSKEFLEAGKKLLAGDTARAATSGEVKDLRREVRDMKVLVADLTLENRMLKKA
jgi:transposase